MVTWNGGTFSRASRNGMPRHIYISSVTHARRSSQLNQSTLPVRLMGVRVPTPGTHATLTQTGWIKGESAKRVEIRRKTALPHFASGQRDRIEGRVRLFRHLQFPHRDRVMEQQ